MTSNLSNTQSAVLPHNHPISDITDLGSQLSGKQDKLVVGSNIQIAADGKTISAVDTKYTAGTNVQISAQNVISATDTTYSDATQSTSGLMSADDKLKLDGIEPGAGVAKVSGVKGDAESSYREGLVNITKANIGLGNVDNTSDANKPVSTAMQTELNKKQNIADMPTKLSDFTNDSGFITNAVNNLTNYYTKTQTYTKSEVDTLISNFGGFEVVTTLPTSDIKPNVIYLLGPIGTGADKYQEYIYYNNTWTLIGETTVDLTNYAQKSEVLTKTNTTAFTPTGDYQPATKKYVDDNKIEYNAGEGIEIKNGDDYSAMQGPAPSGFHVPLNTEWQAVVNIWTALGGGSSDGTNFGIALKLPFAGNRSRSSAGVSTQGTNGYYWSSSRNNANSAYYLNFYSTALIPQNNNYRANGFSVRCFKNSPIVPTNSWTKLYGTSIESGGIFWSSADGLISLSSDGQTWITMADKNLGATTVWNIGDTLSETNCGKYYQWGNNYGFARTGSVTTSSTQVNASNYGPGNYYSSSTFIIGSTDRSSVQNDNLRGGVTGVVTFDNAITNTGVLSVNGQTGDVTISGGTDYSWVEKSGSSIELGLRTIVNTESNITLTVPSIIKDGEEYALRCINVNSYTLTLGEGFTNPFGVDLTLSANATDQFVFLAVQGTLELQPQFVVSEA